MKRINLLLSAMLLCTCMFGQKAPDFTITDYNNVEHTLYEDYLDKGTIVMIKVMFVACPPCRNAAPGVQDLYEHYNEGQDSVEFFELSNKTWDSNASVKGFAQEFGLTFPGAGFDGGALTALNPFLSGTFGSFRGTPTYIIIEPDGDVQFDVRFTSLRSTIDNIKAGGGGGGGGGGCTNKFDGVISEHAGSAEVWMRSEVAGAASFLVNPMGELDYSYECQFPFPAQALEYYVKVEKDDSDIDGVSTADIVRILRHLLALDIYTTTEQKIASDYNANRKVSAQDMSELRKLVLGKVSENPHHNSWIFWSADQDFSNDNSGTLIPRLDTTLPVMDIVNKLYSGDYSGVKLGDVTGDINVFLRGPNKTRGGSINASTSRNWVKAGEEFAVSLLTNDHTSLTGLQGTLIGVNADIIDVQSPLEWEVSTHSDGQMTTFTTYDAHALDMSPQSELLTVKAMALVDGYSDELIQFNDSRTRFLAVDQDLNENVFIMTTPHNLENPILLFPNPTTGNVYLENVDHTAQLNLIDINGYRSVIAQNNGQINTSDLNPGVYWIEVSSSNGKKERVKFLKL